MLRPPDVIRLRAEFLRSAADEAVLVQVSALNAQSDAFAQRHVEQRDRVPVIEVAERALDIAFELVGWLLAEDADRAAGRVAAEQCPLRSAQDFDPVDIEHAQHRAAGARHVDPVDIEADAALPSGAPAARDAANDETRGAAAAAASGRDAEVRRVMG